MKTNVLIIGAVAIGVVSFFGGRNSNKSKNETVNDAKNEINKSNITHSDSWFSQTADYIQIKMLEGWRSSDSLRDVLVKLAGLKNKDDFLYLVVKFGYRSGASVSIAYKENLIKWLLYFLDQDYTTLKGKRLNALSVAKIVLKNRGINL